MAKDVQIDRERGLRSNRHHSETARFLKRLKARLERRKAKGDPEAQPTYHRFAGWYS